MISVFVIFMVDFLFILLNLEHGLIFLIRILLLYQLFV